MATIPPLGSATEQEANAPDVRLRTVFAALELGNLQLGYKCAKELTGAAEIAYAETLLAIADPQREDTADVWLGLLDQLDETAPELLLRAVMHLAERGIDGTDRLGGIVDRAMVSQDVVDTMKAI